MATKARRTPIKLDSVKLSVLGLEGTWVSDEAQQRAAWELYIELVTRIAVEHLADDEGLMREAYSSLYALFAETRAILKRAGPDVAVPAGKGKLSLAIVAIAVLNDVLRPFLAYWHPRLLAHEQQKPSDRSTRDHELAWSEHALARQALGGVREKMATYADLLAQAAGVAPIHSRDDA
jgi:hypothetical protein